MQLYSKSFLRAAVIVAAVLGLSAAAWASPNHCPPVAKEGPFTGAFLGVPTVVMGADGSESVSFGGVGAVTAMGDAETESIYETISADSSIMKAAYIVRNEDGDKVTLDLVGDKLSMVQTVDPVTLVLNVHIEFSGSYQIRPGSGTGRFCGTTGAGTFMGYADASPISATTLKGIGQWAFWGAISGLRGGPHCGH